ncbi:hypothetical protein PVAND_017646 [Polypedilum vanderplanki]|uniref:Uncharacterized protein n=1 Tax=Polypedilum vanderplanki TaxID=319348 RepID=A0A9J6B8L2_POLVA|nr:hypothetical protein PVAND_017646 [Polypedilum vanderplanki]
MDDKNLFDFIKFKIELSKRQHQITPRDNIMFNSLVKDEVIKFLEAPTFTENITTMQRMNAEKTIEKAKKEIQDAQKVIDRANEIEKTKREKATTMATKSDKKTPKIEETMNKRIISDEMQQEIDQITQSLDEEDAVQENNPKKQKHE